MRKERKEGKKPQGLHLLSSLVMPLKQRLEKPSKSLTEDTIRATFLHKLAGFLA